MRKVSKEKQIAEPSGAEYERPFTFTDKLVGKAEASAGEALLEILCTVMRSMSFNKISWRGLGLSE